MPFQSPNFTQVPNDFFDEILPELEKAELKVLLVIIRGTFGYHRDEVKISTREMASMTGLSAASIEPAAKSLESMGLIEKIIDGNKTSAWRAVVNVPTTGTQKKKSVPTTGTQVPQQLVRDVPTIDTLSGLNKDKEKETNSGDSNFSAIAKAYADNIALLVPATAQQLGDIADTYPESWILEAIDISAKSNKRNLRYVEGILKRWQASGKDDGRKQEAQPDYMQNYFGS